MDEAARRDATQGDGIVQTTNGVRRNGTTTNGRRGEEA